MKRNVILVDVSNLAFRSHYVLRNLEHEGKPTGMLFGFLNAVLGLRKTFQMPLVFCWDYGLPGDTRVKPWRQTIYPKYKNGRSNGSDDRKIVVGMLPVLKQALDMLGTVSLGISGLEADDIISLATSNSAFEQGFGRPSLVFTNDRDLYQVLDGEVITIIQPKKNDGKYNMVTEMEVLKEYGLTVERWATYLALGGDKSDGIHVMKGVGPVGAKRMVGAGINLLKDWEDQPSAIHSQFKVCEEHWEDLQAVYKVALLPWDCKDERICDYIPDPRRQLDYTHPTKPDIEAFTGFCLDYGLLDFVGKRRQFFQ